MSFAKGEIKLMMDARIDRESLSGESLLLVFGFTKLWVDRFS
jgi:hypothetical protein